jgi:hypothetical protein
VPIAAAAPACLRSEFIGATIRNDKVPFQQDLLGVLMDLIPPGSTVVDAGANNGMFSAFLAAAVGREGYVYSFEPQARIFQVLNTNAVSCSSAGHSTVWCPPCCCGAHHLTLKRNASPAAHLANCACLACAYTLSFLLHMVPKTHHV